MNEPLNRRAFLLKSAGLGTAAAGASLSFEDRRPAPVPNPPAAEEPDPEPPAGGLPYRGPNVILVRFGGGVRRLETITDPERTHCPFIYHELFRNQGGLLFPNMEIESTPGIVTSHGQGTLYLLTGKYDRYEDAYHTAEGQQEGVQYRFLGERFVPKAPTFFEYFRARYNVPAHQALIINGEDRIGEDFYTFSNHHVFGVRYRSTVLSLYRFKTFLLREEIANGRLPEDVLQEKKRKLEEMEDLDYRTVNRARVATPELDGFWRKWREYYGSTGFVNTRGDRLLTTLALWAIRELQPKLLMINYQDPDYVHWGPRSFYTRAISIIDEGVRELYHAVQANEAYRDNTVFVIVPDCGRDSNRCMAVPFQHHFNTRSAHQIFGLIAGPHSLIPRAARPVDRVVQQTAVARTIGQLMRFDTPHAETQSLLGLV